MGVFDGSIKIPRRITDPFTDRLVVEVASLVLPTINTPAALLYPGTDVSVVHGDQQLHVDLNRFMKVGMNHNVTIGMNEIYLVDMNQTITVMQDYTRDVMMNSLINTTGNYTKNVLSNYTKSITGNSTNAILGFYMKSVTMDYTKTIIGSSLSVITGTYTKQVKSDYIKEVKGTSTNKVTGDYTKLLDANYVKVVTGNSNVQVISESMVQYQGNHSRTFGNNHRMMIAGSNTHTTCGPTILTEIDVQVNQQVDNHVEVHPTTIIQEKTDWFTKAVKKGTYQEALKIDYTSGLYLAGSIIKLDTNVLNIGCNGSHNTFFIEKYDCGVEKNDTLAITVKEKGLHFKVGGIVSKFVVNKTTAAASGVKVACVTLGTYAAQLQAVPAKIVAGIVAAFNSFIM
jgi:hypothetical protein